MKDLPERLRHAAATAGNDDYSKPKTEERDRHAERVDAMLAGADEVERLRRLVFDASCVRGAYTGKVCEECSCPAKGVFANEQDVNK